MTMTIDEALNRAEAMSAGLDWILLSQYEVRAEYASPEVSIDLDNRVIGDLSENVSTEGENNAEYISFIMDRYHDGVDLSNMLIQIQYELEDGSGSIDGVVNAYMNDDKIKFGWVVPPAAAQVDAVIKIMVFCTGTLGANTYTLKTLPMEYTIHSTLDTGGSIPQPDENWYLQFVNTMQQNVLAAKASADAAAQSASDASDDLADIKVIQSDVNSSKSTVQTLAAQVQSNTTKAQTSADAAKVSEQNAQEWFEKTKEHSGVSYASEELAGIISPQDVYINPENGQMSFITQTTDRTLSNSYAGGIKVNEVVGKSEQKQYAGKNLLPNNVLSRTLFGISANVNADKSITFNGTSTNVADFYLFGSTTDNGDYVLFPQGSKLLSKGDRFLLIMREKTLGAVIGEFNIQQALNNGDCYAYGFFVRVENGNTLTNQTFYPMISIDGGEYEPYVGGIPSPNPDYPQEIKSVEVGEIKSYDDNGNESTVIFSTPITLNAIPVSSGGNVTIDGKQYISDYVDVERKKLVRNILEFKPTSSNVNSITVIGEYTRLGCYSVIDANSMIVGKNMSICTHINDCKDGYALDECHYYVFNGVLWFFLPSSDVSDQTSLETWLSNNDITFMLRLATPTEIDFTDEEVQAFLALKSFDTVTYISTDSEIEPVIDLEYGTSRVGALALQNENDKEILKRNVTYKFGVENGIPYIEEL